VSQLYEAKPPSRQAYSPRENRWRYWNFQTAVVYFHHCILPRPHWLSNSAQMCRD